MGNFADDRVYLWTCCHCGHAGMNATTIWACVSCGERRCGSCHNTAHKGFESDDDSDGDDSKWSYQNTRAKEWTDRQAATGSNTANTRQISSPDAEKPVRAASPKEITNDPAAGVMEPRKGDAGAGSGSDRTASANPNAGHISDNTVQRAHPHSQDLTSDLLEVKGRPQDQDETPGNAPTDVLKPYYADKAFPTATKTARVLDGGAVEMFVERVMRSQSLGYLWPQLVERCGTKQRWIYLMEVLLKRYAQDLELIQDEHIPYATSDNRLCGPAARFISRSRIKIADRIWEIQTQGTDRQVLEGAVGHNWNIDILNRNIFEGNLAFKEIEEMLFERAPFLSLQANIKLLVGLWNPMKTSVIYRLLSYIRTSIRNAVSSLREPSPLPGYTRLRYTCVSITNFFIPVAHYSSCVWVLHYRENKRHADYFHSFKRCGRRLYDDFEDAQSDTLIDFQSLLDSYFDDHPVTLSPGDFQPPTARGKPQTNGIMGVLLSLWRYMPSRRNQDSRLQWTSQNARDMELRICSIATSNGQAEHNFVLLCLPFMRWAKKLDQIDTCDIRSDQEFFLSLRQRYSLACRSRRWLSFARLRRVSSLEFVKFEVYKNQLVDIQDSPSVPDRAGVEQAKKDYSYDPLPANSPPIGRNTLMHLFQNPEDANLGPDMYMKIPKKRRDRLQACPLKGSAVGWGLLFTEDVDWSALLSYGCVGFFLSLVFSVAWSIARGDIQSGFAMGGAVFGFVMLCLGFVQMEVQVGI